MENMLLKVLPRKRFPVLLRYGASAGIVAVAAGLRLALSGPLQNYPLLLFFPAVFLCALLFDKGSGFFATLLSAVVAVYLFMAPGFSFDGVSGQVVPLTIFVAIGFTMAAVTEALRKSVERLETAEQAKTLLLEELAHRTKNDLTIISSALTLQARASGDRAVQEALEAAVARVGVVAAAQERLKGDVDGGLVDMPSYLQALCSGLGDLLRDVRPIAVRLQSDPVSLGSSDAVTIGLIVNELVTNAFKYAFPGDREGGVDVEFRRRDERRLEVTVRDDGVGCSSDVRSGMGTRLVRLLAQQHGGTVVREPADPGCRVRVTVALGG